MKLLPGGSFVGKLAVYAGGRFEVLYHGTPLHLVFIWFQPCLRRAMSTRMCSLRTRALLSASRASSCLRTWPARCAFGAFVLASRSRFELSFLKTIRAALRLLAH